MGAPPALLRDLVRFRAQLREALQDADAMVVLFGSQATGRAGTDSDVDILVVSRAFGGKNYIDRAIVPRRVWRLPLPVDFLCYTPEEFARLRGQVTIVRVAMEEGIEVTG